MLAKAILTLPKGIELLFIVYCYKRASAKAEGDETKENVFSQGPRGKPPRHYTILAPSTRSRYTRNIWPEPLMGYLWGWHVTEKTGIISACTIRSLSLLSYGSFVFLGLSASLVVLWISWWWIPFLRLKLLCLAGGVGFALSVCCHPSLLYWTLWEGSSCSIPSFLS